MLLRTISCDLEEFTVAWGARRVARHTRRVARHTSSWVARGTRRVARHTREVARHTRRVARHTRRDGNNRSAYVVRRVVGGVVGIRIVLKPAWVVRGVRRVVVRGVVRGVVGCESDSAIAGQRAARHLGHRGSGCHCESIRDLVLTVVAVAVVVVVHRCGLRGGCVGRRKKEGRNERVLYRKKEERNGNVRRKGNEDKATEQGRHERSDCCPVRWLWT